MPCFHFIPKLTGIVFYSSWHVAFIVCVWTIVHLTISRGILISISLWTWIMVCACVQGEKGDNGRCAREHVFLKSLIFPVSCGWVGCVVRWRPPLVNWQGECGGKEVRGSGGECEFLVLVHSESISQLRHPLTMTELAWGLLLLLHRGIPPPPKSAFLAQLFTLCPLTDDQGKRTVKEDDMHTHACTVEWCMACRGLHLQPLRTALAVKKLCRIVLRLKLLLSSWFRPVVVRRTLDTRVLFLGACALCTAETRWTLE